MGAPKSRRRGEIAAPLVPAPPVPAPLVSWSTCVRMCRRRWCPAALRCLPRRRCDVRARLRCLLRCCDVLLRCDVCSGPVQVSRCDVLFRPCSGLSLFGRHMLQEARPKARQTPVESDHAPFYCPNSLTFIENLTGVDSVSHKIIGQKHSDKQLQENNSLVISSHADPVLEVSCWQQYFSKFLNRAMWEHCHGNFS